MFREIPKYSRLVAILLGLPGHSFLEGLGLENNITKISGVI